MTVDDLPQAMALLEAMNAALPVAMLLGTEVQGVLRAKGLAFDASKPVQVERLFYMGDDGGVLCSFRAEGATEQAIVSLTHLRPIPGHPLADSILAYQRQRVAGIAMQAAGRARGGRSQAPKRKRRRR